MIQQDKIQAIVSKIVSVASPEKVILFGSHAWGKPTKDSDVDLLVIQKSQERRLDREIKLTEAIFPAGIAVDILSYTPEELERAVNEHQNLFLEDIVRNGKILYGNSDFSFKISRPAAEVLTI